MQKNGKNKLRDSSLLEEFFVDELKDIYWAEKHLTREIPKMSKAATTGDLRDAFQDHLQKTRGHVSRLEEIFTMMDRKAVAKKCEAMAGITKEGADIIEETDSESMTRDVGLIMAAQKVEHYEIATYGGLVQLAKTIGRDDISQKLQQTLDEEKEADVLLTSIAEDHVNVAAGQERE